MSTQDLNLNQSNLPEWLDPFPEPHTMPRGWNLDSLMQKPNQPAAEQAGDFAGKPKPFAREAH